MKRKISILGLVLLLVFALTGCGKKESGPVYDQASMEQYAQAIVGGFSTMGETELQYYQDMSDMELELTVMQYGLPMSGDDFVAMLEAWLAGQKECGTFVSIGSFKMETSNDGATLITDAVYEDRTATLEFTFDEKMNMETLTVNADYSLGEILTKAGLNTILGMGTVFVVLIFISFIISLFKYIPAIQEKFGKKKQNAPAAETAPVPAAPAAVPVAETDDSELIAVIAAAIAAAEGTTTDGFVVRSIKRRKSNKWN